MDACLHLRRLPQASDKSSTSPSSAACTAEDAEAKVADATRVPETWSEI